ncbi:MAG TPA: hypothetical protein VKZ97_03025 [Flavobacteriaceae bacterium]|nr:hypothetical protein [Flavobacteriaceae bacterium]
MKTLLNVLLLFGFVGLGHTQNQDLEVLKALALENANTTTKATLDGDYATVIKHTLPSVVNLMGTPEEAVAYVEETFNGMKAQGFAFEKSEVLSVSDVVFEQEQYRCYVQSFHQMRFNGKLIKSKSCMLGIYNEADKFWCFLEAKELKNIGLQEMVLPDFETSLEIPDDEMVSEDIKE